MHSATQHQMLGQVLRVVKSDAYNIIYGIYWEQTFPYMSSTHEKKNYIIM